MSSKVALIFFGSDGRTLGLGMWHRSEDKMEVCRANLGYSPGVGQVRSNSVHKGRVHICISDARRDAHGNVLNWEYGPLYQ